MSSKAKSFKDNLNPALQFISSAPPETAEPSAAPEPEIATVPPKQKQLFAETKSRRLQLLLQPSLYEKIKARALNEGKSVNDLVHSLLDLSISGA